MYPAGIFDLLAPLFDVADSFGCLPGIFCGDAVRQYFWQVTCPACRHKGPPDLTADACVCEQCGEVFGHRDPDQLGPGWQFRRRVPVPPQTAAEFLRDLDAMQDERAQAQQEVARRIAKLRESEEPRRWGVQS